MQKVGRTSTGNKLIEITPDEWKKLASYMSVPDDVSGTTKQCRK